MRQVRFLVWAGELLSSDNSLNIVSALLRHILYIYIYINISENINVLERQLLLIKIDI